ncbi:hypothetical protein [Weissella cibaria]|uniref:hypothetical protein n=1 Tax=Weissella cibaria TaxID=137591 RepID=UPI001FF1A179|nr:hypothetical protein [Weissella cibaria]UOX37595.1 hypothetical protein IDM39_04770 [Weissella cibaria]
MTKYVIDLPAETKVIVAKKPFLLNETDLMRIPVSQLELYVEPTVADNATVEKRVIELPADVIAELKTIKEDNGDDNLQGFMNDVNNDDELWPDVEGFNRSGMPTDALLGEWWLEHVEFVPKKGPRFIINVDSPTGIGRAEKDDNGNVRIEYYEFDVATQPFTEAEADELVAGLTALNARKVKVEE